MSGLEQALVKLDQSSASLNAGDHRALLPGLGVAGQLTSSIVSRVYHWFLQNCVLPKQQSHLVEMMPALSAWDHGHKEQNFLGKKINFSCFRRLEF